MSNLIPTVQVASGDLEIGMEVRLRNYGIKRRRLAMGLTQKQLGAQVGVGGAMIGQVEAFYQKPSASLRAKLAQLLGCTEQQIWPDWMDVLKQTSFTETAIAGEGDVVRLTEQMERRMLAATAEPDAVIGEAAKAGLAKALKTLSYRERQIMKMRYGLVSGDACTYDEIGRVLKVTRERVRQIEMRALRKLQQPVRVQIIEQEIAKADA